MSQLSCIPDVIENDSLDSEFDHEILGSNPIDENNEIFYDAVEPDQNNEENVTSEPEVPPLRRSGRIVKPPSRYGFED